MDTDGDSDDIGDVVLETPQRDSTKGRAEQPIPQSLMPNVSSMHGGHTPKADHGKRAQSTADFKREALSPSRTQPSAMSSALKRSDGGTPAAPSGQLSLRIYLPSRKHVELQVPDECTVSDTLTECLRAARGEDVDLKGDSTCYELRLHDGGGEPDEDFPALDRARKIKNYGRQKLNEYVLVVIPAKMREYEAKAAKGGTVGGGASTVRVFVNMALPGQLDAHGRQSVEDTATVSVPVTATTTVRDILFRCARICRFSLYHDSFQVQLTASDHARLKHTSSVLPQDCLVAELQVEQLQLTRRVFADTPPPSASPQRLLMGAAAGGGASLQAGSGGGVGSARGVEGGAARGGRGGGFSHNILTASEFKEWKLIKINKRGRRQVRLLGIDLERVTNNKVEKRRLMSNNTHTAERLVTSILKVFVRNDEESKAFSITYAETHGAVPGEITLSYEAASAYERAEILAKLEFIMGLNNDAHKIVRER